MAAISFTGERYIPGEGGSLIAYEHWHRYLFSLRWASDKKVVDVAAGTGYGSGLLASAAQQVWALDYDEETIAYARSKHDAPNLLFLGADAASLPLASESVDLVVAFEILEHMNNAGEFVSEAARVIRSGGVVLVSTPDKALYSDARNYSNSFHTREFYHDELRELLQSHFGHVAIVRQRVRAGSMISVESGPRGEPEVFTNLLPGCGSEPLEGMYFIAICSKETVAIPPSTSIYLDLTDTLFREADLKLNSSMDGYNKLRQKANKLVMENQEYEKKTEELKFLLRIRGQEILRMKDEFKVELDKRDKAIEDLKNRE